MDTNNNPIANVLIKIGSKTAMTDINGVFIIQDATINERFGYVTAEKSGFIHASRAVVPNEGTNKVTIMMLPETVVGSTSSDVQETISLENGASASLEGDYIKPDGSSYTGNVNVIMHHLDPTDENMNAQMPGMLYAANSQNEDVMLKTFGMLAVELRGENGEDLNLAEGSSAEIRVPLDPSLLADAPSTIPLWYFDEVNGYWVEDGQATLVGNEYVGTVTHFSFWNCDVPTDHVNLCINIINANTGAPMEYHIAHISSENFGSTYSLTNENGVVCGLIPANDILELTITNSGDCNQDVLYFENLGSFSENTNLTISLTTSLISETVIGQLNNCSGEPITNGYVELNYLSQRLLSYVDDGNFELNIYRCENDNNFQIVGYDFDNLQQTNSINYTFTTPLTNIGLIQPCNTVDEFITYDLGDNPTISYFYSSSSNVTNGLGVYYFNANNNHLFDLYVVNYNGIGTYNNCIIRYSDENGSDSTILGELFEGTINITSVGEVGEFIDLNFSGIMVNEDDETEEISGSLHVIRTF